MEMQRGRRLPGRSIRKAKADPCPECSSRMLDVADIRPDGRRECDVLVVICQECSCVDERDIPRRDFQ